VDLPYLAVDGHARVALFSGWCWRYYSCAYCCVGRSGNAEDYGFIKSLYNLVADHLQRIFIFEPYA
jgi:hypothetical protein